MLHNVNVNTRPMDMTQLPPHVDSKAAHNRLGEAFGFSPSCLDNAITRNPQIHRLCCRFEFWRHFLF